MKKSTKVLVAGAAMAGLMTGYTARTYATQSTTDNNKTTISSAFGLLDDTNAPSKHDCKGKNACKGQGGCKSDKNACKGQNACKGAGGCNTKG